jgi:hypothetical protein
MGMIELYVSIKSIQIFWNEEHCSHNLEAISYSFDYAGSSPTPMDINSLIVREEEEEFMEDEKDDSDYEIRSDEDEESKFTHDEDEDENEDDENKEIDIDARLIRHLGHLRHGRDLPHRRWI